MPRGITRRLFTILNNEQFRPVELLDLQLPGSTNASRVRLTSAGEVVHWKGNDYLPVNMGRGLVEEILATETGQVPSVSVTVTNIDGQMADLLNRVEMEGAKATAYLVDRSLMANARDAIVLTDGEVTEPQLSEQALTFQITNVLSWKDRLTIPRRLWKKECNYAFGSRSCGVALNVSPVTIDTTAQAGSTEDFVVVPSGVLAEAGSPGDPNEFWANGYVVCMNGAAALQSRPIQRFAVIDGEHRFYLRYSLLNAPAAGDDVRVRRMCNKTKGVGGCQTFQGNVLQYGGFAEVPYGRIKPKYLNIF